MTSQLPRRPVRSQAWRRPSPNTTEEAGKVVAIIAQVTDLENGGERTRTADLGVMNPIRRFVVYLH
jgi:hypothetical protein